MMPRKKVGFTGVFIELADELVARTHELAKVNDRPFREEVAHAIERHLSAPPTIKKIVEVKVPDLPPATVEVAEQPKPKRGRPPKQVVAPQVGEQPAPVEQPRKGRRKGGAL